ncbi:hypothetical protein P0082_11075 [Candidatus Haliotispira prima]|uniref:Uncharacterized protein n=1 Tax=Candidatus Haliotispira prima TaxID=3034016 RepID=A0ABY8MHH5_9SPIO|nr:hypothetical protein P0082_11075 [Candidatus Haliotispira prima]
MMEDLVEDGLLFYVVVPVIIFALFEANVMIQKRKGLPLSIVLTFVIWVLASLVMVYTGPSKYTEMSDKVQFFFVGVVANFLPAITAVWSAWLCRKQKWLKTHIIGVIVAVVNTFLYLFIIMMAWCSSGLGCI